MDYINLLVITFCTALTLHYVYVCVCVCVCLCASYQRWEITVYTNMSHYPTYLTTLKLQLKTLNYNSVSTTVLYILMHIQDTAVRHLFRLSLRSHLYIRKIPSFRLYWWWICYYDPRNCYLFFPYTIRIYYKSSELLKVRFITNYLTPCSRVLR